MQELRLIGELRYDMRAPRGRMTMVQHANGRWHYIFCNAVYSALGRL